MKKHVDTFILGMHERPEHERRAFAMWVAIAFTAFIFLFWLADLNATLASVTTDTPEKHVASPVSLIGDQFGELRTEMKQQFGI